MSKNWTDQQAPPNSVVVTSGSHVRRKSSSTRNLRLVFALLVFLCCAITLRLHSQVISKAGSSDDVVEPVGAIAKDGSRTETSTFNLSAQIFHHSERSNTHPRLACFVYGDYYYEDASDKKSIKRASGSCPSIDAFKQTGIRELAWSSVPMALRNPVRKADTEDENEYGESDTCNYPEPSKQVTATSIAPSTCNDIHSLGFDSRIFDNRHHTSKRESVEYITSAFGI